jgi:hypothetical protein
MTSKATRYTVAAGPRGFSVVDKLTGLIVVGPMELREAAQQAADRRNLEAIRRGETRRT